MVAMKSTTITIRTDPQLLDRLRDAAKREDRTVSALINRLIKSYLDGPVQPK